MTAREEIAQLRAEIVRLQTLVQQQAEQIAALTARLAKDSHNSSKPPSSDGYARKRRQRPASATPSGGQTGHTGHTLQRQATPTQIVRHRPTTCGQCQRVFADVPVWATEQVRQVLDLPTLRIEATDHIVETVRCPQCAHLTQGDFPAGVVAPVQYGPQVQALAVYLNEGQLLPSARTVEVLADVFGITVSEGSLETWVQQASIHLQPWEAQVTAAVIQSPVIHGDETGIRLGGKLHWLHVASTTTLTLLRWHRKRGQEATEALGVWPQFQGIAVHDRWPTYWRYSCQHALCHAHLQRDLTALAEDGEEWAGRLAEVLRQMYAVVTATRQQGRWLDAQEQDHWTRRFSALLNGGFAAHPPTPLPTQRGRPKHTPGKNLLDALHHHEKAVLAFLTDPRIPLTNNQAERDLRMAKVQQKISGTFRSPAGATAFCRIRSLLGTARKQGHSLLATLAAALQGESISLFLS